VCSSSSSPPLRLPITSSVVFDMRRYQFQKLRNRTDHEDPRRSREPTAVELLLSERYVSRTSKGRYNRADTSQGLPLAAPLATRLARWLKRLHSIKLTRGRRIIINLRPRRTPFPR
jgi:hypothetical protein